MIVDGAPGGVRLKRNVSPCLTPAGTRTLTAWAAATSPSSGAGRTPLVPHLASPAAARTGPAQRDVERKGDAGKRLTRRQRHLGRQRDRRLGGEERVAHAIEDARHRGKVDRYFVGEPGRALGALGGQRAVVLTAARRIAQDVVGASQLLERQTAIVSGDVRVIAARKLPVGTLDFIRAGIRRYAEDIVVVTHTRAPSPAERVPPFTPEVNDGATIREG